MRVRDLRCPAFPRTKFAEVWLPGGDPEQPVLIRVGCRECRRAHRASGHGEAQVVHVYDGAGVLQTTDVEPPAQRST